MIKNKIEVASAKTDAIAAPLIPNAGNPKLPKINP